MQSRLVVTRNGESAERDLKLDGSAKLLQCCWTARSWTRAATRWQRTC
ncbi:Uncharacterised protein [Chromobacterium violaceum]|uniref:Uncharacterized protein n=1 Tax=Chromobacterium violaceum TaxID=536 RepID=A0A447T8R6_CHRVL|nr:Uncharacterised protein [Chromobacterium violaceum]